MKLNAYYCPIMTSMVIPAFAVIRAVVLCLYLKNIRVARDLSIIRNTQ